MNTILTGIVGSRAYGLETPSSDTDRISIHMAPLEAVVGLGWDNDTTVDIENPEGDWISHELGKFLRLALSCNPTVTEALWLDSYDVLTEAGERLRAARKRFLSLKVADSYGGYAMAQLQRLRNRQGESFSAQTKNRTPKHARHLVRLLVQGEEILRTGELHVMLTPEQQAMCWEASAMKLPELERLFTRLDSDLRSAAESSKLPVNNEAARPLINQLLVDLRLGR